MREHIFADIITLEWIVELMNFFIRKWKTKNITGMRLSIWVLIGKPWQIIILLCIKPMTELRKDKSNKSTSNCYTNYNNSWVHEDEL